MRQLKITKQVTNRETASLDKYLQEIGKVELITAEEEVELAQRIISGKDYDMMNKALDMIRAIAFEPTIGEVYEGIVRGVQTYGAFVEIAPKIQGLLHISEIDWTRVKNVEDVLKEGDTISVKLLEVDKAGKMKLSRKVLLPKPEKEGE